MPISFVILDVIVISLAFASGVVCVRRLTKRGVSLSLETMHRHVSYLLPMTLVMLVIVIGLAICNMHNEILWELPLWVDAYSTRIIWGLLLFFLSHTAGLLMTCARAVQSPDRLRVSVVSTLLVAAFILTQWSSTQTIAHRLNARHQNNMVVQTKPYSCTAASAANMLRYFNIYQTEPEMAKRMETTVYGSTTASFIREMKEEGLASRRVFLEDRDIQKLVAPAMMIVDVGQEVEIHAVVYAGINPKSGLYIIWDPGPGRREVTAEQVKAIWHGRAVECWRLGEAR